MLHIFISFTHSLAFFFFFPRQRTQDWLGEPTLSYLTGHKGHFFPQGESCQGPPPSHNLHFPTRLCWVKYRKKNYVYHYLCNQKAGLHWSSWMPIEDESPEMNSMVEQNSVYTLNQHWTRSFILKMAATELERLCTSVVCDCVINDRRKTTEKGGLPWHWG